MVIHTRIQYGRNTSTAFALSSYALPPTRFLPLPHFAPQLRSGTIGSAMAASLSGVPSIALSFGLMDGHKPPGADLVEGALKASCEVMKQLWEMDWGEGLERVDLFSVNVPVRLSTSDHLSSSTSSLTPKSDPPGHDPAWWARGTMDHHGSHAVSAIIQVYRKGVLVQRLLSQ